MTFFELIDSVNTNLGRAEAWHSPQGEREGGVRCFPEESMNLHSAKMGNFSESAQMCRNSHPCLQYRIFQVFVCSSVCGKWLQSKKLLITSWMLWVFFTSPAPHLSQVFVSSLNRLQLCSVTAH